jgi:hypothetical protein
LKAEKPVLGFKEFKELKPFHIFLRILMAFRNFSWFCGKRGIFVGISNHLNGIPMCFFGISKYFDGSLNISLIF